MISYRTFSTLIFPAAVGKSSLISTFVSRYFSENVPAIMTRVRLPPDPNTSYVTTIVDSQGGDTALLEAVQAVLPEGLPSDTSLKALLERATEELSAKQSGGDTSPTLQKRAPTNEQTVPLLGPLESVDSIVLVYDLDRVDTFHRLEDHWLPLIERCYGNRVRFMSCIEILNDCTVAHCSVCLLHRFQSSSPRTKWICFDPQVAAVLRVPAVEIQRRMIKLWQESDSRLFRSCNASHSCDNASSVAPKTCCEWMTSF
jgi:hypothetical protein